MALQATFEGAEPSLPTLFSPFDLGGHTLKNRIVNAPHGTYFAADGLPTAKLIAYYEEKARGGAALIVAGNWSAWPRSMASPGSNSATDPRAVTGHRQIAEAVHRHGSFIVAQLHDSGRQGSSAWNRRPLLAPSPLADPVVREIPKELEREEIEELIASFGASAGAMQAAGWDGVEILAAQGYGVAQFLSPQTNRRTDEFGGDLQGRATVLLRMLDAIRAAVGPDFLVGVRMNGSDMIEGGATIEDACALAELLESSGLVDYLSISGASNERYPLWIADMTQPRGLFVDLAAQVRTRVSLPLLVVTRIKDPVHAESILAHGTVDLVGMVRALIADPELPNKAMQGRLEDVRPCISCNQGCIGRVALGAAMGCTVNPAIELQGSAEYEPSGRGRRVVVVGGGPAGLEASVRAAERGHAVVLFEADQVLGGQLAIAARCTSRSELGLIVDYLEGQARKLGVDLRLGQQADLDAVRAEHPDMLVVATGSRPVRTGFSTFRPSVEAIPGHELPHVITAWEALSETSPIGARVVVVDDDPHGQATTAAEHLSATGHDVTIVCRSTTVGLWSGVANQDVLYERLLRAGVRILTSTWVDAIQDACVEVSDVYTGRAEMVAAHTVVLATGNRVRDSLYHEAVRGLPGVEAIRIGDCLAPRRLDQAIWDGYHAVAAISVGGLERRK